MSNPQYDVEDEFMSQPCAICGGPRDLTLGGFPQAACNRCLNQPQRDVRTEKQRRHDEAWNQYRAGVLDVWTLAETLGIPNMGKPPEWARTIVQRLQAQRLLLGTARPPAPAEGISSDPMPGFGQPVTESLKNENDWLRGRVDELITEKASLKKAVDLRTKQRDAEVERVKRAESRIIALTDANEQLKAGSEHQHNELKSYIEANRRLAAAYLRVRSIAGAFYTPPAPTHDQIYRHTEDRLMELKAKADQLDLHHCPPPLDNPTREEAITALREIDQTAANVYWNSPPVSPQQDIALGSIIDTVSRCLRK